MGCKHLYQLILGREGRDLGGGVCIGSMNRADGRVRGRVHPTGPHLTPCGGQNWPADGLNVISSFLVLYGATHSSCMTCILVCADEVARLPYPGERRLVANVRQDEKRG